jgi:hypothetical protein
MDVKTALLPLFTEAKLSLQKELGFDHNTLNVGPYVNCSNFEEMGEAAGYKITFSSCAESCVQLKQEIV